MDNKELIEDYLLTDEQIKSFVKEVVVEYGNSGQIHEEQWDISGLLKAQAKITWEAKEPEIAETIKLAAYELSDKHKSEVDEARKEGIKEIVGWLEENSDSLLFSAGLFQVVLTADEWQAKLKEWGID